MGDDGCRLLGHGQFLERMHLQTRDMGLGHISILAHCCLLLLSSPPMLWEPKDFSQMLFGNEDKCVLSKGEVAAVRNMPVPTFPSWEGTLTSRGAHETSERGSQLPEVSAEQVDMPEGGALCGLLSICGQRTIERF